MKLLSLFLCAAFALLLQGYPEAMLTPDFLALLGNDQVLADKLNPDRQTAIENYLGNCFVSFEYPDIVYAVTPADADALKAGFAERFDGHRLLLLDCTESEYTALKELRLQIISAAQGTDFEPYIDRLVHVDAFTGTVRVDLSSTEDIPRFNTQVSADERIRFEEIPILEGTPLEPSRDGGDVAEATIDLTL